MESQDQHWQQLSQREVLPAQLCTATTDMEDPQGASHAMLQHMTVCCHRCAGKDSEVHSGRRGVAAAAGAGADTCHAAPARRQAPAE